MIVEGRNDAPVVQDVAVIRGLELSDTIDDFFGGDGDDLFLFADGDGTNTINDFTAGAVTEDVIEFSAVSTINNFAEVLTAATDDGTDTTIVFGGDSVTLLGVVELGLDVDDFLF